MRHSRSATDPIKPPIFCSATPKALIDKELLKLPPSITFTVLEHVLTPIHHLILLSFHQSWIFFCFFSHLTFTLHHTRKSAISCKTTYHKARMLREISHHRRSLVPRIRSL